MGLLNPGGPIAQFKRNRCSISPVEVILLSGVRNIALQILDIAVRYVVVHNYSRLVLSIVEEVQFVAALSHVMNVLAMQGVVGRTRE